MGLEPTTPGATVQCSNQLSYGHRGKPQGPNRTGALAQRLAFHLPRRRAAVDDDRLARHPGRRIGREEDARERDLLDLAPASHADARGDRVVRLLAVRPRLLEHVQLALGLHRPRRDAVHANALASPGGAEIAYGLDDGLEVLELARAERHVRAGAGELDRDGFADAGTAAGDDRGFSLERER